MSLSRMHVAIAALTCVCPGLLPAAYLHGDDKAAQSANTAGDLQNGWERVIEIPAFKTPTGETILGSSKLMLWVEQGWLSVRRNDADGSVEWQVVLAQPHRQAEPVVVVDTATGGLDLSFGHYFIRENVGRLRILRQRKDSHSPPWPSLSLNEPPPHNFGSAAWRDTSARDKSVQIKGWRHHDWCWAMSGLPDDKYDIWLRLEHKSLRGGGNGFTGGPLPPHMFYGDKFATDDGDLFYALRSPAEPAYKAVALQKLRQEFAHKPAPSIVASQWLNSPAPSSLDSLRGKVVLLDFWGTWCGPCVANLPKVQALHEKYKDRGLIVIGVHSEQDGETVSEFLKGRPLSFPIAIDTGETAKGYGVETWPTYFLIDKSGKSPWGFSSSPPSAKQIEELLQ